MLSQIRVNFTTLKRGRLGYFFDKEDRMITKALDITLLKVCPAAGNSVTILECGIIL
jgi:hypothetical protein